MDARSSEAARCKVVPVRTVDGQSTEVLISASSTVAQLKALVVNKLAWPSTPLQVHLILRGSKVKDTVSIESLPLRNGEFLVAVPYSKKFNGITRDYAEQTASAGKGVFSTLGSAVHSSSGSTNKSLVNAVHENFRGDLLCGNKISRDSLTDQREKECKMKDRREIAGNQGAELAELCPSSFPNLSAEGVEVGSADSVWQSIVADLAVAQDAFDENLSAATDRPPAMSSIPPFGQKHCCGEVQMKEVPEADQLDVRGAEVSEEPSAQAGNSVLLSDSARFTSDNEESVSSHDKSRRTKRRRKEYTAAMFDGPVPPVLEKLISTFSALNTVCGFLQKQHMQPTWNNVREAIQPFSYRADVQISSGDIHDLATLCPQLVIISNLSVEGANTSFNIDLLDPLKLKQYEQEHHTRAILATDIQQIGPEDVMPSASGAKTISDSMINRVMKRRLQAFRQGIAGLLNMLKAQSSGFCKLENVTLGDLLNVAKQSSANLALANAKTSALPRPPRQHKKLTRCIDVKQLSAFEILEHLRQGLGALGQIVHCEQIHPRKASYRELDVLLSTSVIAALAKYGITRFYSHQAQAINAAISRENVIIATSTASGKSVCYNTPVLEDIVADNESCALYLFPTKALARDQLRALQEMTEGIFPDLQMGVYDGDTLQDERLKLRDNARILITNPDMLHVGLLSGHAQFRRFFSHLRFVVVDEAHAYRGAFGCHTAVILRRLRRLCHHTYGAEPTFIICSATVANPREHAMELVGLRNILVVEDDGSPCGEKFFAFWNPPMVFTAPPKKAPRRNNQNRGRGEVTPQMRRSSSIVEVASLLAEMVQHGLRCIAFCKTRKLCELVHNYTREILKETAPDLISSIRAYRSGYTAEDRRAIERDLFGGKLRAVAATNALELGVDVGSLDVTLHLGFPGTVASLWQQAGRAGRREKASLSIYVAFGGPLDQHFMKNPKKLFSRSIESAQVDAQNHQVLEQQLCCAAAELPLQIEYDERYFGSGLKTSVMKLVKQGLLGRHPKNGCADESWHYIGEVESPSQSVSIRAIDPDRYTIINEATNKVIEEVEANKAFFEVYEGAVYMHQGKTFLCKVLDVAARVAVCREADVKYYTKTRDFTDVHVTGGELAYPGKAPDSRYPSTTAQASFCKVTTRWIGFRRIWQGSCQTFDSVPLFLPDVCYESQAAWIRVPHKIRWELEAAKVSFREGLHAASHALLNVMPLYIMCNPSDLGTECANPHDTRYYPERLLVYDRHPGGIGIAAQARPMFAELLQAAWELLASCECSNDLGCPNCVQYLECSEYNEVINKKAAILILEGVIKAENDHREGKQESSFACGEICKS